MTRTANEAVHSYVTDMLALENHIGNALRGQLEDFERGHPLVSGALKEMHATVERHEAALKALEESHHGGAGLDIADFIKRAATTVAGMGAAAFDMVRTEKLPKNLRDDYTAFSLATVGYMMLLTTARSLNEERVAQLAEAHFNDYVRMVKQLEGMIPATVVALLREDGLTVDATVLEGVEQVVKEAWKANR
jgi:hypothetical protein